MVQNILITISQVVVLSLSYYYLYDQNQVKDFYKEISMIRHGARSPNKYTDLDKKLWKDFPPGFLTEKGFQQHIELGQTYRKKNIYQEEIICSRDNFYFIVSSKPRVLLSFIGFMQGACPNNYAEILKNYFTDNLKQHSLNNQTFNAIMEQNFQDVNQADLEIFKMKSDMLFHGHSDDQCPILADIDNNVLQTEEYNNKEKEFLKRPQFKEVLLKMQKSNPSLQESQVTINKMKTFFGGYKCNQYQGFEEPQLSEEAQKYLSEIFIYKFYNMDNSNKIQHLSALTEIFKWIISRLNDDKQISLYFGHDSNQVAVASVILETPIIFPFASKLSFIITGEYVNLKFQDTILPQKMCKTKFNCTKREAVEFFKQYISNDLQKLCNS